MAEDKKKDRVDDKKITNLEDNKTEVSLQKDVEMIAALKLEIEALSSKFSSSKEEKLSLTKELEKLATALEKSKQLDVGVGCQLALAGKLYRVDDIDLAWEVGQKVEKSFVDEDALTLVLSVVK